MDYIDLSLTKIQQKKKCTCFGSRLRTYMESVKISEVTEEIQSLPTFGKLLCFSSSADKQQSWGSIARNYVFNFWLRCYIVNCIRVLWRNRNNKMLIFLFLCLSIFLSVYQEIYLKELAHMNKSKIWRERKLAGWRPRTELILVLSQKAVQRQNSFFLRGLHLQ